MTEKEREKLIRKEKTKLKKLLKASENSDSLKKTIKKKSKTEQAFESIIENVALMKVKLDELREELVDEEFIVEYDNGGGQKGIRENPIFKRYESFFKTYMIGMSKIIDALPEEAEAQEAANVVGFSPPTILEQVLSKSRETA